MTIHLSTPQKESDLRPRITVIGVGGAGGNAVNNMISSSLEGVDFLVANTDAQALGQSLADRRIQLGITVTQGLGAGARPAVGKQAAEEALPEIMNLLQGANMVFVTAGMGGGTGTGAAPVIAAAAREQGILTVGVVTKPFHFEGRRRMLMAEEGISELEKYVDTLIIIPNQNLFKIANEKTTFADAFKMADDVLYMGVRGVTDLMVMPGLINLDFADIRTVMSEMGKAMMGTGEAEGADRAKAAAEAAISNPLLEDASMKGARGVLINITGGLDMTLLEVDEAANRIREEVDPEANIIFGSTFDAAMQGRMRVSVVATGIAASVMAQPVPTYLSLDGTRSQPSFVPTQRPAAPASVTAALRPSPFAMPPLGGPASPIATGAASVTAPTPALEPAIAVAPEAPAIAATAMPAAEPEEAATSAVPSEIIATPTPASLPDIVPLPAAASAAAPIAASAPPPVMATAPVAKPLVGEHDWRITSRPAAPPKGMPIRVEPMSRPSPAKAAPSEKSPSLFQRFTGAFGSKPGRPETARQQELPTPIAAPVQLASAAPARAAAEPAIKLASREEEDLSIPAFLRRQAN